MSGAFFWSSDGQRLVVMELQYDGMYTVNTDGTGYRLLVPGYSDALSTGYVAMADWSPNGEWIAYQYPETERNPRRRRANAAFVIRSDGTGKKQLTPPGLFVTEGDGGPVWSPDGQWLAFSATRSTALPPDRPAAMYLVNADGSRLLRVSPGETRADWRPVWRPERR